MIYGPHSPVVGPFWPGNRDVRGCRLPQEEGVVVLHDVAMASSAAEIAAHLLDERSASDGQSFAALGFALSRPLLEGRLDPSSVRHGQLGNRSEFESCGQRRSIDDPLAGPRLLDFVIAPGRPVARMRYDARPHHVEVGVCQTAGEVDACLDRSGVIPILPECSVSALAAIVPVAGTALDELHARGELIFPAVADEQLDLVAGDRVVEDAQPEAAPCVEQPVLPGGTVAGELEEKLPAVAAVGEMPHISWLVVSVRSWHELCCKSMKTRSKERV